MSRTILKVQCDDIPQNALSGMFHEGIADQNRRNRFLGHIIQYGSKRPYNYSGDHLPMLKHNTTIPNIHYHKCNSGNLQARELNNKQANDKASCRHVFNT